MESEELLGNLILRVNDDLVRLQDRIKLKQSQDQINVTDIKDLLANAQNGLQKRAEEILTQINNRVTSFSSLEGSGPKQRDAGWSLDNFEKLQKIGLPSQSSVDLLPLDHVSPGEAFKRDLAMKSIANPYNRLNRHFVGDRMGIQLPLINERRSAKIINLDAVRRGSVVKRLERLPLEINKNFNNAPSGKITELDANKGLLNLIERGLIPPNAKITFDPPAINHGVVPILSYTVKQKVNVPAATNDQGFSVGNYHLDESNAGANDYLNDEGTQTRIIEPNTDAIENMEDLGAMKVRPGKIDEIKKSILQKEKQKNIKAIKTIQFTKEVEEREIVAVQPELVDKEVTIPPPTTPASTLSKYTIDACHKFTIRNGAVYESSEDFIRFKRHYCLVWGGIVTIIHHLESLLSKYSIPVAFINGDRVADLSVEYELELKPSEEDLLFCIINRKDVLNLMKRPGRRFIGENGKENAATVIQSKWRSYVARKFYLDYRHKRWAAGIIAIQWILHMKMAHVRNSLQKTRLKQLENYRKRYQSFGLKWKKVSSARRVVIHIPSIGLSEELRSKMRSKFPELQNRQMSRLCDLKDPSVDVIYVSPVPVNDELLQYYSKLLALKSAIDSGNSNDQTPINSRYRVIVPEAIKSFPNHNMCLSTLLKYSPRAMNRIKQMIKGRVAWIVPGMVHVDDLSVADELSVPILGTEPEILHTFRTKSNIRKLLQLAKVNIPPGETDIMSKNDLFELFAQLITDNLHIKKWIFKTNYDIRSQGIAYVNIDQQLSCYTWAQKEQMRYGEKWKKKWAQEAAFNRILREIPDIVESKLVICDEKRYPKIGKYLKQFFKQGGIIEAYPGNDSVTNITVDIFIDPTGEVHITGSGDQIHDGNPVRSWGYSVPQSSIDSTVLNSTCNKIVEICKNKQIRGYFSIDFVTFVEGSEENQVIWAVDINFSYSDMASLINLATFSTNANFNSVDHVLSVELVNKSQKSGPLNRYICMSTQIMHSNLTLIHYSVFFQMCRAHGIGYDLKDKQGTVFALVDSFDRENICMITIGSNLENTLETFAKNLYVLHQEISSPNMPGKGNFQMVIKEIENILGLAIENAVMNESKTPINS